MVISHMRSIAQREDIRDLILDGVDILLGRYGFRKMTMEDLARQVGIGKGTIYLHFPSKEEVTLSHIDRIADRLLTRLSEIASGNLPVQEKLSEMLQARVLHRFDSVRHYSENLNDLLSALRRDLLARREHHFKRESRQVARVLEEGRKKRVFDHEDSEAAALAMIWSTNSLLPFSLSPRELGHRREIEERVAAIAELLIRGVLRRTSKVRIVK